MQYLAAVIGSRHRGRWRLFPRREAREAAVFVGVLALFVDLVFYVSLAEAQLDGPAIRTWSTIKVALIVAGIAWLAIDAQAWALGLIAGIFVLIGLEDSIGITAPLGVWLIEEGGLRRGPRGTYEQLLRRSAVTVLLLGPTIYLGRRAEPRIRAAVWALLVFLGAFFLLAVLGDVFADRRGTNLDDLLEGPLMSLGLGFVVGLIVARWPERRLKAPTTR